MTAASVIPKYMRTPVLLFGAAVPGVFGALKSLSQIEKAAQVCSAERQELLETGEALEMTDILTKLLEIMQEKGDKVVFHLTKVESRCMWHCRLTSSSL